MKKSQGRSRYFCVVTYASEKQLRKVMREHVNSIRAFCYIYHDVDEAEPHYHILMRLHSAWTSTQITKWFAHLVDDEKKPINTFAEVCHDMEVQKMYILHEDAKSIEEGKHRYNRDQLKEYGYNDLSERKDCYDNSYEILCKVLEGATMRELVRHYGRDFLYHYNQYTEVANMVRTQDVWRCNETSLDVNVQKFLVEEMETLEGMEVFDNGTK